MRLPLIAMLAALGTCSQAMACDDTSSLGLDGSSTMIPLCDGKDCIPSPKALHDYADAQPDQPGLFTIAMHSSPWRFYDGQDRIIAPAELAAQIREHPKFKAGPVRVVLYASWSGVAPTKGAHPLAEQLADALSAPVEGAKGFVWFNPKGDVTVTRQSFTIFPTPYKVAPGDKVMAAAVIATSPPLIAMIENARSGEGMRAVGVSWDAFSLCPVSALAAFERGAEFGDAISAYNAALMRLSRNDPGDRDKARSLLEKAAALGDEKARAKLAALP